MSNQELWIPPTARNNFKKAPPPKTGASFDAWGEGDIRFVTLPGGGTLQFDLSKLTLSDFRSMRDHYQINASLKILTFMIHQLDWHIECEDKKIADEVEKQVRARWTRLVRGMAVAFWAGYGPSVLEFENNAVDRKIELTKVLDVAPERASVNWKKIEGYAPPGKKGPQIKRYDGMNVIGNPYPVPPENTLWYPLLMESGDYYGTRLLKPAFPAWFFSQLIHLFANRYFERFGEPLPIGRADYDADVSIDGKEVSGKRAMEQILTNLRNRSVVVMPSDRDQEGNYIFDLEYLECVDEETEIFTANGWKSYDELSIGDEALTLNHESGMSEWQAVEKVNVHDVVDREMVLMEGSTHSSLTTTNHRWPVLHTRSRGGERYESREWKFTSTLDQRDRIPLCAPMNDFPKTPKYDDDFVELVAWYWTEGYTYVGGNYVSISQKKYPERIRAALTRLFGPARDSFPRNTWTNEVPTEPIWRENGKKDDEENRQFFLNYAIVQLLKEVSPDKIVTYDFMRSLTKSQLDLFIESSLLADGNVTARQSFLMQKPREMAERFQFACTLAGHATSFYSQEEKRHEDYLMWVVSIRRKTIFNPIQADYANGPFSIEERTHTGKVWCPTTENGTWLARRNGTVYFTGNSQMRGADFERYMSRLDEEMSLGLFTPILLFRTADVGSYNLGVSHMQVFLWMLNALAGDMKEYIDEYICERIKAINFSPLAPRCEWVPRKMGKENVELLRSVVTELVRQGGAGVDFDEVSQAAGITIKEKRILDNPDGDPNAGDPDDRQGRPERDQDGPNGPGQERETGRKVSARVAAQISNAFDRDQWEHFTPDWGFKRKLSEQIGDEAAEAFYSDLDRTWQGAVKNVSTMTEEEALASTDALINVFLDRALA